MAPITVLMSWTRIALCLIWRSYQVGGKGRVGVAVRPCRGAPLFSQTGNIPDRADKPSGTEAKAPNKPITLSVERINLAISKQTTRRRTEPHTRVGEVRPAAARDGRAAKPPE